MKSMSSGVEDDGRRRFYPVDSIVTACYVANTLLFLSLSVTLTFYVRFLENWSNFNVSQLLYVSCRTTSCPHVRYFSCAPDFSVRKSRTHTNTSSFPVIFLHIRSSDFVHLCCMFCFMFLLQRYELLFAICVSFCG